MVGAEDGRDHSALADPVRWDVTPVPGKIIGPRFLWKPLSTSDTSGAGTVALRYGRSSRSCEIRMQGEEQTTPTKYRRNGRQTKRRFGV